VTVRYDEQRRVTQAEGGGGRGEGERILLKAGRFIWTAGNGSKNQFDFRGFSRPGGAAYSLVGCGANKRTTKSCDTPSMLRAAPGFVIICSRRLYRPLLFRVLAPPPTYPCTRSSTPPPAPRHTRRDQQSTLLCHAQQSSKLTQPTFHALQSPTKMVTTTVGATGPSVVCCTTAATAPSSSSTPRSCSTSRTTDTFPAFKF
jgi:hypothetical protein